MKWKLKRFHYESAELPEIMAKIIQLLNKSRFKNRFKSTPAVGSHLIICYPGKKKISIELEQLRGTTQEVKQRTYKFGKRLQVREAS